MTDSRDNVSYILVPFYYSGKRDFDKYVSGLYDGSKFIPQQFKNDIFLSFIETLFKNVTGYKIAQELERASDSFSYCFDTGMGFLVLKYLFSNSGDGNPSEVLRAQSDELKSLVSSIEKGENKDLARLEKMLAGNEDKVKFFYGSSIKKCMVFSMAIGKMTSDPELFWVGDISDEQSFANDKLHLYRGSTQKMSIITDQYYGNLAYGKNNDLEKENSLRTRYEDDFLMMFILLHHERQMYFYLRDQIVADPKARAKRIKTVKESIIKLLTCYSYKIVTEDVDFQRIYEGYREVLNLTEYEDALSDLIFRLNEESDKGKERRLTIIEIFIALIGLAMSFPYLSSLAEAVIKFFH